MTWKEEKGEDDEDSVTVSPDHAVLVVEMKNNDKLPVEERIRLAKLNRVLQLTTYQYWDEQRDDADEEVQHPQTLSFSDDICLMDAATKGQVQDMQDLLRGGMNPNTSNHEGLTALHQCCIDGQEEIAELLIKHGASVSAKDRDGWTPMHAAATCGHIDIVKMLIKKGADLLAVNCDGDMPFDITEDNETLLCIERAMTAIGITPDTVNEKRNEFRVSMTKDVQLLIDEGEDLSEPINEEGATLLHVAIVYEYNDIVKMLIEHGASDTVEDVDGWRPIHAAAFWNNKEAVELLTDLRQTDLRVVTDTGMMPFEMCDNSELKDRILEIISQNQDREKLLKKNSVSNESGDDFENTAEAGDIEFVDGKSTEIDNDTKSDRAEESEDVRGKTEELLAESITPTIISFTRVESMSSRRNSVREAKRQAPIIRFGQLSKQDSFDDSYDDSYDLMLTKSKREKTVPQNSSQVTHSQPIVISVHETDIAEENYETTYNKQDVVQNIVTEDNSSRSSSESSASENSDTIVSVQNGNLNNYQNDSHENSSENFYANGIQNSNTANIYECDSPTEEKRIINKGHVYENENNDKHQTENMYEALDLDIESQPKSEDNRPPPPTYDESEKDKKSSADSNLNRPPALAERTIFTDIMYISPTVKAVKVPKKSSFYEDTNSVPTRSIGQASRDLDISPSPTLNNEYEESDLSPNTNEASKSSDPFTPIYANVQTPKSIATKAEIPEIEAPLLPAPVRPHRKKYDALKEVNRPGVEANPKRGTLLELKLKRQLSRNDIYQDGNVNSSQENYARAEPRELYSFKPPDSPTRIRHVFKQPIMTVDDNIFKQKRRCVVM